LPFSTIFRLYVGTVPTVQSFFVFHFNFQIQGMFRKWPFTVHLLHKKNIPCCSMLSFLRSALYFIVCPVVLFHLYCLFFELRLWLPVKNVCGHIFIWDIKFAFFYDFSIVCWNCSDSAELFCFSFYEALTNLKLFVKFKSNSQI
jgi:hypothetical protein